MEVLRFGPVVPLRQHGEFTPLVWFFLRSSTWHCAIWLGFPGLIVLTVIGRGFRLLFSKARVSFFFCRSSPLGGSKVQAAVMPPAPGVYDGGFGAQEAVTPSAPSCVGVVKLFGACVVWFGPGVCVSSR